MICQEMHWDIYQLIASKHQSLRLEALSAQLYPSNSRSTSPASPRILWINAILRCFTDQNVNGLPNSSEEAQITNVKLLRCHWEGHLYGHPLCGCGSHLMDREGGCCLLPSLTSPQHCQKCSQPHHAIPDIRRNRFLQSLIRNRHSWLRGQPGSRAITLPEILGTEFNLLQSPRSYVVSG